MEEAKVFDYRGISDFVAAELLTDTAEEITYGEVFAVAGIAKLTKSTETSTATKYYDNKPKINTRSVGPDEVGIEASGIEDDKHAKLMGEDYDEETGMYVEGEPETKYWAFGYVTKDTNGVEYGVWRLKGTTSYPETEHNTEDDGTDSTGTTMTYTGVHTNHKFKYNGKTAKAVRIPLDNFPGGKDAWLAQVQTPDTIKAAAAAVMD